MTSQTDYCPISIGVEVLGDRWTPLVIREMMVGSQGFNEIHRGIPRISRTLLAQRLRLLERQGLISSEPAERGRPGRYTLTRAGEALTPIVWALGHWAAEWVFSEPADAEADGLSLIWRMHQLAVPARLPAGRTLVHVVLTGAGGAEGWLDITGGAMSVCRDDQGVEVNLAVEGDCLQMQRWVAGLVPFSYLQSEGHARMLGPSRLARAFPSWFETSIFAAGLRRGEERRADQATGNVVPMPMPVIHSGTGS